MAHAIDRRYAQALADLVAKGAIPADVARRELAELATLVSESVPLRTVVASPAVSWEKKVALLDAVAAKAGVSRISRNFMIVTAQRGRFGHLNG
ncbi:MAG: F0F1 ATP synthase subunit delta, partial [Terriglobales bacterium]